MQRWRARREPGDPLWAHRAGREATGSYAGGHEIEWEGTPHISTHCAPGQYSDQLVSAVAPTRMFHTNSKLSLRATLLVLRSAGCPIALSLLSTSPPLRMVAHRRQNLGMYSGPPQPLLKDGQLNSCNILTGTTWPVLSVHDFRCCATFITYSSGSMPAAVGAPLHRSRKEYSGSFDRTSRLRNKWTARVLAAFKISWSYQS